MRFLALLMLLGGCGSDSSKGDSAPPAPEVERLNVDESCTAGINKCSFTMTGTFTSGEFLPPDSKYSLVVALAEGAVAPACDGSAKSGTVIQFTDLKTKTAYMLHGCIFDSSANSYSDGITIAKTSGAG